VRENYKVRETNFFEPAFMYVSVLVASY